MNQPDASQRAGAVLWLTHARSDPAALAARVAGPAGWLFLGGNYVRLRAWEHGLGARFQRIRLDRKLDATARHLRAPFLDAITQLGRRQASLAWWTSRVAERNTIISPLFLNCCHLRLAAAELERTASPLCVVGQSWAVLRSLARAASRRGWRVRWVQRPPAHAWLWLRQFVLAVRQGAAFARRTLRAGRAARRLGPSADLLRAPHHGPCVVLRSYVDDACCRADGSFRDRHLPGLAEWFERRGCNVWIIPVLQNVSRSYEAVWEHFRSCRQRFINPDAYFAWRDLAWTCWVGLKQVMRPTGPVRLEALDVTALFDEDRLRFGFEHGALQWILMTRLPHRLRAAGLSVDLVIHPFENQIPDRSTVLGFRGAFPRVRIVGYQHSTLPPMLLCLYPTAGEAPFAPLPDRVVCTGRLWHDVLVRGGLAGERVRVGPALRYAHLHQAGATAAGAPCVLVALPVEKSAAVEVLVKTIAALGGANSLPVRVKRHPMMPADELLQSGALAGLPTNFAFVTEDLAALLPSARVLVSAGSAVLLEAMAAGVPVVVVGRETALDLNPLAWLPEHEPVQHTPAGIRAATQRLWGLSAEARQELRRCARDVLAACFSSSDPADLSVFCEGLIDLPAAPPATAARPDADSAHALACSSASRF
jgi:glycosyltransferase involved in cell wall biosynthesis